MPQINVLIKPVSSACNMYCRYCFYTDVSQHRQMQNMGVMSEETLHNMVRKVMCYADESVTFAFQGGEPTLAGLNFYKKLVELQKMYNAKHIAVYNSLQTNGYNLSNEMLQFFKEENFLLGVSYDGTDEIHDKMRLDNTGNGTAHKVRENIKRMQNIGVQFNILCVLNRYTARHPDEIFENLSPYGYIQFIPCLDGLDGQKEEWSLDEDDYLSFLKRTFDLYYRAFLSGKYVSIRDFDNYIRIIMGQMPESCGMCGRCAQYYLVEADGGVYPCDFYVLDKWKMGNINDNSVFKLAKSEVQKKFVDDSLIKREECTTCPWEFLCHGGCRRDREPFPDGKPSLNVHCSTFRNFFEYSYERMTRMAYAAMQGQEKQ